MLYLAAQAQSIHRSGKAKCCWTYASSSYLSRLGLGVLWNTSTGTECSAEMTAKPGYQCPAVAHCCIQGVRWLEQMATHQTLLVAFLIRQFFIDSDYRHDAILDNAS